MSRPIESLVSGACGLIPADLEPTGAVDNPEAGRWACQDARAVYLEVMGPRLERERQREAVELARREGGPPTRSRFL